MEIYLLSLLFLSLFHPSTSINNYSSKLLSLSIKNTPSFNTNTKTNYFSTNHYEFDIDPYDDIASLNIFNNQIIINTHLNETFTLNTTLSNNNLSFPISLFLDYDDLSDWNSIFSHSHSHLHSTRRRLSYYNHYKHKGRYVADGILRRFKDGQANCRHLYGDLASIMSKEEEEQVKDLCAMWNLGNCWIGYKKPWGHWEDGRRPTYLHWKPGEPNNYGGNEDCAEIHTSGQWNDIKCTLSRVAICERARIHVVGHYVAVMRLLNFEDANKRCQELFSTDLATIENARENVMVRRACAAINPEGACWIGLKRPFRTWMDGEDAKVMNWGEGEPNNAGGNENCAEIKESQRWNDNNCAIGQYFVCNTITQQTRMKKRAEQKRRAQEKEAELDKKRKKIEDEIMERYMRQNQNSMMGKMLSGQGLYGGANGIGSPVANMRAYGAGLPDMKQMYAMGSRAGQRSGMFNRMLTQQTGSMGGIGQKYGNLDSVTHHRPNYQYNHGSLDHDFGTLAHGDSKAIYGDLGPLGKSDGVNWTPGQPLRIQLVGSRRRRLQVIEEHKYENVFDDIFGKKCVHLMNDFNVLLCVGHNYVDLRQYDHEGIRDRKMMKRQFEHNINVTLRDNENWINEDVAYYVLEQFVFDNQQSGELKQCFGVVYGFEVCLKWIENEKNMVLMIGNDGLSVFDFEFDENWDEVETIYKEGNEDEIVKKCNDVMVGRIETKMCIQKTINKEHNLSLYRLIVQYLADNRLDAFL